MDHSSLTPPRGTRPRTVTIIVAAVLIAIAGAGTAFAAGVTHQTALSLNWYESAPYYSVLDSSAPSLPTVMSATGQKAFDLGFILADNVTADVLF